ncbi:SpaA isopeptide-forming pilin-related protein [Macrococcus epidermidis]|uniref:SpaA isopeptide-forming pilin-related protein n=1 Tax=Macrococcus epidermidis TaxID=1902580 RepID=UPI0020B7B5DA|nr:SpaA isopeptide-forming pilin-related protein [Macrococcus epidermidis]UTH15997.1 VWA domain-containing protein [Macrococcus epidermidis]
MFAELIYDYAYADEYTRNSDNQDLVSINMAGSTSNKILWDVSINSKSQILDSNELLLKIQGEHSLDLEQLKATLNEYQVVIEQSDKSKEVYVLKLKDNSQSINFKFETSSMDNHQSDYSAKLSLMLNNQEVSARDYYHQKISIKGNITFVGLPNEFILPESQLSLVDTSSGEVVKTIRNIESKGYEFSDLRKFNENGEVIDYKVVPHDLINYEAEVKDNDVIYTFMTTSLEGVIENKEQIPFTIHLINKNNNEKVKEKEIRNESNYSFQDLPKYDEKNTLISYAIQIEGIEGYNFEITNHNITVIKENDEKTITVLPEERLSSEIPSSETYSENKDNIETSTSLDNISESVSDESSDTTTNFTIEKPIVNEPSTRRLVNSFSLETSSIQSLTTTNGSSSFVTDTPLVHSQTGDTLTINGTLSPDGNKINWTITIGRNGNTAHNIEYRLYNMVFSAGQTLDTGSIIQTLTNGSTKTTKTLTYNTQYKAITGSFSSTGTSGGTGPSAAVISFSTTITDKTKPWYNLSIGGGTPGAQFIANNQNDFFSINGTLYAEDKLAPTAPQVNTITSASLSVTGTAEPNTLITVLLPNGTQVTGPVDASGNYKINIPAQIQGSVISVTAKDSAGNLSSPTKVTVSNLVPTTIGTVYDNQTSVLGTASPGLIVTLTNDKDEIIGTTKAGDDGKFYVELFRVQTVGTIIYAEAKNASGQVSNKAQTTVLSSANVPTPGNGLPIVEPSPSYKGAISDMSWDERGLYRNRVPQPVEYTEGFLWKAAQPTSTPNKYAIDLKTQGRDTISQTPLDIVFVIDNSKSMETLTSNGSSRWQNMKTSVNSFIDKVTTGNSGDITKDTRIGIVNYATKIVSQTGFQTNATAIKNAIPNSFQQDTSIPGGTGHTFTQLGIRTGSNMLSTARPNSKKIMILLTDGAPTFSYKGLTATTPENISSFSNVVVGNGAVFPLNSSQGNFAYSIGNVAITNHGQPTISEAKLIKAAHPDYEVYAVGLETNKLSGLDLASVNDMNNVINYVASDTKNAFVTNDTSIDLPNILSNIAQNTVKSISTTTSTTNSGTITDPIGEMYDLDLGTNNTFDTSDYKLTSSHPDLLKNVTVNYDVASRTIMLKGATLGKGEWININYKVSLRTSDPNFKDDQWYPMNGKTTVQTATSTIDFPVPEAKYSYPTYSFSFIKMSDKDTALQGAIFSLTNSTGTVVKSTSDNLGLVKFSSLKAGNYALKEIQAPAGYLLDNSTHSVAVSPNGAINIDGQTYDGIQQFKLTNKLAVGALKVKKYDAGNNARLLAGAVFELKDENGKIISTLKTDDSGIVNFDQLPFGDYLLTETIAPAGYQLDNTQRPITIDGTTVVTKEIANKRATLPNTGGRGTVMFTITGIGIMIATIMLRRRKN